MNQKSDKKQENQNENNLFVANNSLTLKVKKKSLGKKVIEHREIICP